MSPTGNADRFLPAAPSTARLVTALAVGLLAVSAEVKSEDTTGASTTDVRIADAWKTLRAVDCARCHGKDYDGLAAPSIIEYARTQSREMFVRMVLDGDPGRGMPGYRNNPRVLGSIDDIYRYFLGRAKGNIGEGPPAATP